jgi:membrane associated rhomboid family serine protease
MAREFAPVTALLALTLVGAYILELDAGGGAACQAYGLIPIHASLETAFSSLFLHDPSSVFHLGGNLVFLVIFGGIVERALGSLRFAGLYAAAGLGGCALHIIVNPSASEPLVGASGALFGLLAVAAVVRPRMLGFAVAFAGVEIWHAIAGGGGNVSFGCHLGGFAVGAAVAVFLRAIDSEALEAA